MYIIHISTNRRARCSECHGSLFPAFSKTIAGCEHGGCETERLRVQAPGSPSCIQGVPACKMASLEAFHLEFDR